MDLADDVWSEWLADWRWVVNAVGHKQAKHTVVEPAVAPPADDQQWERVADLLGVTLPPAFESVVRTRSARVAFHWELDGDPELDGVRLPVWGGRHPAGNAGIWSLDEMPELMATYAGWMENCWSLPQWDENEYLRWYADVWYDKAPFIEVGDGDMIGFEMKPGPDFGSVVYLCHDEFCEIHGKRLGRDFVDFISRWSRIGCVGPEGWEIQKFFVDGELEVDRGLAPNWRAWLDDPEA